tara:strand:+ start:1615 stop:3273 length:1659 start_codon:yes stop_codon:yes gene_type:complete
METYFLSAVALAALYKVANKDLTSNDCKKSTTIKEGFTTSSPLNPQLYSTSNNSNNNKTFTSLTGEKMKSDELQHNNMVHYYGTTKPGRHFNEGTSDSRLDNMVGSASNTIHKKAQPPLFKPQNNLQWVNGIPNNTEFIRSRMNTSIKKHHEHEGWISENVGPGLTKQYDVDGTHGFNSSLMSREQWQPKTVDDLRVVNNPKQTFRFDTHKGPAHSAVKNISEHSKVNKNRPDTHFNHGPARYFTSNVINNPMNQPESLLASQPNNRSTTHAEYMGVPGNASLPEANQPVHNFDKQNREHIYSEMFGTPSSSIHQSMINNNESFNARPTYRAANSQPETNLNINGMQNSMGYIRKSENAPTTRKEELINNHSNGIISKIGAGGQPLYDPNDIPNPTIKESTMYSTTDNPFINKDVEDILPNHKIRHNTNRSTTSAFSLGTPNNKLYGTHDNIAVYNQRNNHNRSTTSWTPPGGTNVFNNSINMQTVARRERDNTQARANFKTQYNAVVPNKQMIGAVYMPQESVTPIKDFLNSDLLKSFKENPYTHSLQSVA